MRLPEPDELDFDYSNSLEAKLEGLASNAAVSFARECLRLDPKKRPAATELLNHDYFNEWKDQFEDEIKSMINKDKQEADRLAK